jgi:uncharacterized protein YggE
MNNQERVWKIGAIVGILLIVFLAVLSLKELKSIGYIGKSDQVVNTISVDGKGEAVVIPDIATFSFTVTESSLKVTDAQSQATAKTNATLKAIRDGGVADKDIKTTSYSINPHYEYQNSVCTASNCRPGKSVLTGYEVSQTIEVKVRDLTKAGSLFESIGALGVQNVNGLSFSVDKPESVKAKARAEAITDAQDKAKELANQLGVHLVRIVSFTDSNDTPYPVAYGFGGDSMMVKAASVAPEIPTGEQKIVSNVTITYEIE